MIDNEHILKEEVKGFYELIKSNDVVGMEGKVKSGFPLKWMAVFSETSLPEYAMRHGNVEAAWWLMANGTMPDNWTAFSGNAWKSFLKKGLAMAMTDNGPGISLGAYKNIVKIALKKTGENLPSFIDSAIMQSSNVAAGLASSLFNSLMGTLDKLSQMEQEKEPKHEKPEKDIKQKNTDSLSEGDKSDTKVERVSKSTVKKARKKASAKKATKKSVKKNKTKP